LIAATIGSNLTTVLLVGKTVLSIELWKTY